MSYVVCNVAKVADMRKRKSTGAFLTPSLIILTLYAKWTRWVSSNN
jgi:hypothetical protein